MKECLENLVGLSRSDCECYTVDEIISDSKHNLFIDELEGIDLELIKNSLRCGDDLLKNFNLIYENAVNLFESDLQVAISNTYKQRYKPYTGRIGELKYTAPVAKSPFMGMKLETNQADGANIVIDKMYFFFDAAGTVNLQVYKNTDELLDTITVDVAQGKTEHILPTPLSLPIVENGYKNDYYFVYDSTGLIPLNNKAKCSCAGIESVRGRFLKPKGIKGTSIDNFSIDANYAMGISLNATISCAIDNLLCGFFRDSTFDRRASMALWYKLGALTIGKLFESREINFDTFSDREYLYGRRNHFNKNYRDIVQWLSENTTIRDSQCFICDSSRTITMGRNLI